MKKYSDELFQLIHTLDSREKAFIKQSLSNSKVKAETTNSKLFTYLCTHTEYDEEKMVESLPLLTYSTVKYSKNTLYDYLLKKLELYYSEADEEQQLYKVLFQIRLLRKKKFFSKANQLLNFAMAKAERFNFFMIHIQLLKEQQQLALDGKDTDQYEALYTDNRKKQDDLYGYYVTEQNNYKKLSNEINKINFKDSYVTGVERERILKAIHQNVLNIQQNMNASNFPSTIKLHVTFLNSYVLAQLKEYNLAQAGFEKFVSDCEVVDFGFINPEKYMAYLYNGVAIVGWNEDKNALNLLIKKIDTFFEALSQKQKSIDLLTYYYSVKTNVIAYLYLHNEFEAAKIESEKILPVIVSEKIQLDNNVKKIFLHNLCKIYLHCDEPKKSLQWYNFIIKNKALMIVFVNVNYEIHITILAVFYELKMFSNMESLIRQCKRDDIFEQQSAIYKELIDFFVLLQKVEGEKERVGAGLKYILKKISDVSEMDKDSIFFLENTNIGYWLDKKLQQVK